MRVNRRKPPRRRGTYKSLGGRRRVRRTRLAAGVATLVFLSVVGPIGWQLARDDQPVARCLYVLGSDHSGSQDSDELIQTHIDQAKTVLERAAACGGVVVIKAFRWPAAESTIWSGSLVGEGNSDFARRRDAGRRMEEAERALVEVFTTPARGLSNHLGFIGSVTDHLRAYPTIEEVHVWDFGDAINTAPPLQMRRADLTEEGIREQLDDLDLPRCGGWTLNFIGVNRTQSGSRDDGFAREVHEFWKAYAAACGADLGEYDTQLLVT